MKLYYSPGACSLADHIALIESGLKFDTEQVDLKAKRTADGEDYKAINPKGYVPALELDDGEILTENIAVLSYISDVSSGLLPSSEMQRLRVLEMTAFVSTELHKGFKPFFSPDATDADRSASRNALAGRFTLVAEQLGDRNFIVGDRLSVADCYLFVMLLWAKTKAQVPLPGRLDEYFDNLRARPAFTKALVDEGLT